MKSICIKSLHQSRIMSLIEYLEKSDFDISFSYYRFKIYDNLIIHFPKYINKEDINDFLAIIIKRYIEDNLEKKYLKEYVDKNYFYLSLLERKYIYEISNKVLDLPDEKIGNKNILLFEEIKEYVKDNNKIYLDGLINFRIKEYKILLEKIVEVAIISYLDLTTF